LNCHFILIKIKKEKRKILKQKGINERRERKILLKDVLEDNQIIKMILLEDILN
jgi:hypothetical protein